MQQPGHGFELSSSKDDQGCTVSECSLVLWLACGPTMINTYLYYMYIIYYTLYIIYIIYIYQYLYYLYNYKFISAVSDFLQARRQVRILEVWRDLCSISQGLIISKMQACCKHIAMVRRGFWTDSRQLLWAVSIMRYYESMCSHDGSHVSWRSWKDCWVHHQQIGGFNEGDTVSFTVVMNKEGNPQASGHAGKHQFYTGLLSKKMLDRFAIHCMHFFDECIWCFMHLMHFMHLMQMASWHWCALYSRIF